MKYKELQESIEQRELDVEDELLEKRGAVSKLTEYYLNPKSSKIITIDFLIDKEPESYVRERKGRSGFYNPKQKQMLEYRSEMLHQMLKEDYDYTRELIKDVDRKYTIKLEIIYYLPIPKADSAYTKILKGRNEIKPFIRVDLDNYDKFLLDSMHEVLYDDDKRVMSIKSEKKFGFVPRTEIHAKIIEELEK